MSLGRDISRQLHYTLLDGANTIRDALGLPPKKDYGPVCDRIEAERQRKMVARCNADYWYDDDEDTKSLYEIEAEEERQREIDEEWGW